VNTVDVINEFLSSQIKAYVAFMHKAN